MKTTNLKEWARREVDLVKANLLSAENVNMESTEFIPAEYEAAYRIYCNFLDEFERLKDGKVFKTALIQLLHDENLSPIVDSEDDWILIEGLDPGAGNDNPEWSIYQCKRRSSLFKKVIYDGDKQCVSFKDTDRAVCIDINKENSMYTGGIGPLVLDEVMPITLPYSPCGKIRIFTEDFKYHEETEDELDTVGVLYFRMPDGTMKEVKRYFKDDHETNQIVEISQSEYLSRKKRVEDRMKK